MTVTDQTGYVLTLPNVPQRVVSLVPSQTELLHELGLDEQVLGITRFCVHPDHWFRGKIRIGGTKKVHVERIRDLGPDLVLANKEENTREDVERIREFCPVWTSDIVTVDDALSMITEVAGLFRREKEGARLAGQIRDALASVRPLNRRAAYLIWKDPYMVAGGDSFISEMMKAAGITNVFAGLSRYPVMDVEQMAQSGADLLLLSSEPYPFRETDVTWLASTLKGMEIRLVDGEMFSWYGSRMRYFPDHIHALFT